MLIRPALADEDALRRVRSEAIMGLVGVAMSVEEAHAWVAAVAPDRFTRAIREQRVWVAQDTEAVGWVEVAGDRIAALYVVPVAAGRGVGSKLLALAETAVHDQGHPAVRLEASANSVGFYVRRGYLPTGAPLADGSTQVLKDLLAG